MLLVGEEYHKLLGSMDYLIENASVFPNLLAKIYNHIYGAAANEKLFLRSEVMLELSKALKLSIPDLFLMPFVEHCKWIEPLLTELHCCGVHREFISSVLKLYEPYKRAISNITTEYFTNIKPVLTEREEQIAQLVAQGLSIGRLDSSYIFLENTVKTILKHVFEKIGVSSRSLVKQYITMERDE